MRFWWAALVVASVSVVAQCGGTSLRREAAGDGDGSEAGGTSGSSGARGGTGGTAGASAGGAANPSGGRGGAGAVAGATTAGGGRSSGGGSGGNNTGADGGIDGAAGADGGAAGQPECEHGAVNSYCSLVTTCSLLDCYETWSPYYYDKACMRAICTETGICPNGQRCVPAPVLGKYDDPCFYELDGCDYVEDACTCSVYEECAPLAVCVTDREAPPSRDCPIDDGMSCGRLAQAVETVEAYRDGTEFFFPYEPPPPLAESVEACATRLAEELQARCE